MFIRALGSAGVDLERSGRRVGESGRCCVGVLALGVPRGGFALLLGPVLTGELLSSWSVLATSESAVL